MKLVRFGAAGEEKPGLLDAQGVLRDASSWVADWRGAELQPEKLALWRDRQAEVLPAVSGAPRLGCPVAQVGKIVCVGLNYADHAAEAGAAPPAEPVLFMKAVTAISGPNDDIQIVPAATKVDWEVELGVVIGSRATRVSEQAALGHVAGYVLGNDVSERAWQMERGGTWDKGKSHDSFAPLGPWLLTADEVADPHCIALWLEVNGQRMQSGNTRNFIFGVPKVISYISQFMTLEPGDVILTGTPAGVGLGQKPQPVFLKPGDVVRLGADGLGEQRQVCVAVS
ncbi:fumarylacetoacetate hydrolase family protein [Comamonas testosteroni]|uniref:5-oxopent-3-ene-1,2,5-tricarboxylate decarboxylase n=1 Tax=Comamonas testosteroni (strain DSM 14576 / KF-1) TaxID=399795 RepID=B7X3P7_COMTK|nr:fumarylacetoacetate hydrolase family protein [Comamonas testosteroni]EED66728.1 5-oxopent-3-ene-1,2,5-tricarboxylate decarboxylase [Comamonas testosteroni KF-1]WQG64944.1 fumarylacetoacetate hydrolase family protein [Comamonas testosteroni]